MFRSTVLAALAALSLLGALSASAAPLQSGNVLVSTNGLVREYTPTGTLVRSLSVPYPGGSRPGTESVRDVVVTPEGNVEVYNGTFDPYLTRLDVASGTWTHRTYPGWSTVNNVSYGGLARFQNFIFATDMMTYGTGDEPKGLVRFDLNTGAWSRFSAADYIDVTVGLDGLVYALAYDEVTVEVFDPRSLLPVRTVSLPWGKSIRGIAVSEAGDIYGASWDNNIYRFNAGGALIGSILSGGSNLTDINVSPDGTVVAGSRFGHVIFTNLALSSVRTLTVGGDATFVTFVQSTPAVGYSPGNILVSRDGALAEYTPNGALVQSRTVPATAEVRDLTVDYAGGINVYNGTFTPQLSRFNGLTGTWTHQTFAGWSTVNNVSYGGVASWQGQVFATDMFTYSGGELQGLVRFQLAGETPLRFATAKSYTDVTLGLDGLLYALADDERTVSVYQPSNQALVRTVTLPWNKSIRGIAVSGSGEIYGASWDGNIYRFGADGVQLGIINGGAGQLVDIDIAVDGRVAAGAWFGRVVFTDLALSSVRSIPVGTYQSFVAFPVPAFSTN
jgi:hypothetical protein